MSDAEKDVMGARIWAGIHFRTADEHGIELGHAIAQNAVSSMMSARWQFSADVCFWPLADVRAALANVRFEG
jgi:hypothetical protein